MTRKSPNKILAVILALVMLLPLILGMFDIPEATEAVIDTVDEFRWNLSDLPVGAQHGVNIPEETQNVRGQGTQFINITERADFVSVHSAGTPLTGTEGASQILVDNMSSKWCNTGVNSSNAWFILDAGRQIKAPAYAIRSANDCTGYTSRFMHTWTVQGSNNPAGPWTTVSSPGSQGTGWNANYQLRMFDFNNNSIPDDGFRYYRLNITRQNNTSAGTALGTANTTMQFSYFGLIFAYETIGTTGATNHLLPQVMTGMSTHWQGNRPTMNGPNALLVTGNIINRPTGAPATAHAKSYTTIKSDLNIEVYPDTRFGYMFAPEARLTGMYTNDYDYKYHGLHFALDLKFSDGTRLSQLGAFDQYGNGMHPNAQGKGKVWYQYAWNNVESEIGRVAAGKIITDIIVGFEMEDATWGHKAAAWFDDINIYRCPWGLDYSQVDLADFVDIRQGTNSSGNATAAITPSVALPYATQYWAPSTQREGGDRYSWHQANFSGIITSHLASRHMGERLTYLVQANSVTVPSGTAATQATTVRNAVFGSGVSYPTNSRSNQQFDEFAAHNYHYGIEFQRIANQNVVVRGTKLEVTPTEDGAVFRFTFPAGAPARNIMIDSPMVNNSATAGNNDSQITYTASSRSFNAWIQRGGNTNNSSQGNGALRRKFMYGEFSAAPTTFHIPDTTNVRSMASFPELRNGPNGETIIEMRVACSWISAAQARNNFKLDFLTDFRDSVKMSEQAMRSAIAISSWTLGQGKWFEEVKNESKEKWNNILGAVEIDDPTANWWQLNDFYSKLSRSILFPTRLSEFTGNGAQGGWQYASPYRGTNQAPIIMDGHMIYNEGWWDTFKSKWPLMGFLYPDWSAPYTDGIIQHYIDQNGLGTATGTATSAHASAHSVPRWINPGGNNMMTGTSSDAVISDMYVTHGVPFEYLMHGYHAWTRNASAVTVSPAFGGRTGLHEGIFQGYHPWGSSAAAGGGGQLDTTWSLEGYISDAAQANMLRKMAEEVTDADIAGFGNDLEYWQKRFLEEAIYYESRARNYVHLFDTRSFVSEGVQLSAGWFVNKNASGSFTFQAFNPLDWGSGYTEDNAWPYRVLVPQDGRGLANLLGMAQNKPGLQALGEVLDEGFYAEGAAMNYRGGGYGGWIHEGTEKREVKMGQYGQSNQPAYHMPWMYLHSDRPWQAQYWTRTALARAYASGGIGYGYMGEEDNGAMASWYVWAAMGLYPLDLASGALVIGSPNFTNMTITNDMGRKITIDAPTNSLQNVYIQSIKVNGEEYTKPYLCAELLADDLLIEYVMGPEPNKELYTTTPPSFTQDDDQPTMLVNLVQINSPRVAGDIPEDQSSLLIGVTGITLANSANLFNRNAGSTTATNEAVFNADNATITLFDPVAPKLEIYTMTRGNSANNRFPTAWIVEASNNGEEWVVIDERSGERFNWNKYTRPFTIAEDKQGEYEYYRINIRTWSTGTGSRALSQIEFLADRNARSTFTVLGWEIDTAQDILDNDVRYGQSTVDALEAILKEAREMIEDGTATNVQISAMMNQVKAAVAGLIPVRDANQLNVATEFNESSGSPGREGTAPNFNINATAPNSWVLYKYIDFDDVTMLFDTATLNYAADSTSCNNGSSVEVRIGSPDGMLIAVFDRNSEVIGGAANPSGNWSTGANWTNYRQIQVQTLRQVEGIHDVYLVFRTGTGTPNQWVGNIRNFSFGGPVEFEYDTSYLLAAFAGAQYNLDNLNRFTPASQAMLLAALNEAQVTIKELGTQFALDRAFANFTAAFAALRERPIVRFVPTAVVTKLSGNQNLLTVTVREFFSDGSFNDVTEEFKINNNAEGRFYIDGRYNVFVKTQGNTQIRDIYIVNLDEVTLLYGQIDDGRERVSAYTSATVSRLPQGNLNALVITVTEEFNDDTTNDLVKEFRVSNNASGIYHIGEFIVFVTIRGSDNVTEIYIVNYDVLFPPPEPEYEPPDPDEDEDEDGFGIVSMPEL